MITIVVLVSIVTVIKGVTGFPLEGNGVKAKQNLSAADITLSPRSILTDPAHQWIKTRDTLGNPYVFIPYQIGSLQPQLIPYPQQYVDEFANKSCIQWIDVGPSNNMHVIFTSDIPSNKNSLQSCFSVVGWQIMSYEIHINTDCAGITSDRGSLFNIPHEMMHALGFIHEHQRADRDCYVTINDKFKQDRSYKIYTYEHTDLTFPYNPKSVMQYPGYNRVFSKFGETLGPETDSLDSLDWMQVNHIYCDGPHICQTDPGLCEHHKNLKLQGGCPLN